MLSTGLKILEIGSNKGRIGILVLELIKLIMHSERANPVCPHRSPIRV